MLSSAEPEETSMGTPTLDRAEQEREAAEIDTMPEAERQEIRDIYAAKGCGGTSAARCSSV